ELLARLGRRDAAGGARKQPHVQTGFKITHSVAERRLRNAKLCGGAGETALPGDHHKRQQIVEIVFKHVATPFMNSIHGSFLIMLSNPAPVFALLLMHYPDRSQHENYT